MGYHDLTDSQVIEMAVDYIKHDHKIPEEIVERLDKMGMKDVLMPFGELYD